MNLWALVESKVSEYIHNLCLCCHWLLRSCATWARRLLLHHSRGTLMAYITVTLHWCISTQKKKKLKRQMLDPAAHLVIIDFHCIEKSSINILLNFFCVPGKKGNTGLTWRGVNVFSFSHELYALTHLSLLLNKFAPKTAWYFIKGLQA